MGMTSSVYGVITPDNTWKKMKAIWDACEDGGITPPKEVVDFFRGEEPDFNGSTILLANQYDTFYGTKKYSADMKDGFEVDITKLPPHVKIIRFVNSY